MTTILIIFAISLGMALILTPLAGKLGCWGKAMDKPDGIRKNHSKPTPRTGGIAIFLSFVLTIVAACFLNKQIKVLLLPKFDSTWGVIVAGLLVFGVGLWDDFRRLNHHIKFMAQIVAATLVFGCGYRIQVLSLVGWQFGLVVSYGLTVFWFLIFINAVNLIDGLDGLSSGVCFFCCLVMTILTLMKQDYLASSLFVCLSGVLLGFLRYNFNPASIFMGDGGSYFLGFAIAMISLSSSVKSQTGAAMMIPVLALGVPMFDTILSPIRRFAVGKGMFKPDNRHIHHKLAEHLGLNKQRAVWIIYLITAGLCVLALFISNLQNEQAGIFLILIGAAAIMFVRKLGYLDYVATEKILGWIQDMSDVSGITKDRRTFLNLQMNVASSQHEEEFWMNICEALNKLTFDHAEMTYKTGGNEKRIFLWSRDNFDVCTDVSRECLMKLELPLIDEAGNDHGSLWLLKDVRKNPISHYTLKRVEHLRRTIVGTMTKKQKIRMPGC